MRNQKSVTSINYVVIGQKIVKLIKQYVNGDTSVGDTIHSTLRSCLSCGDDAAIQYAFESMSEADIDLLSFFVDDVIQVRPLVIVNDTFDTTVFAIPLVFGVKPSEQCLSTIDIADYANMFHHHGLVSLHYPI
jgi:hypothetical protein